MAKKNYSFVRVKVLLPWFPIVATYLAKHIFLKKKVVLFELSLAFFSEKKRYLPACPEGSDLLLQFS